jgi:hypothetical protein
MDAAPATGGMAPGDDTAGPASTAMPTGGPVDPARGRRRRLAATMAGIVVVGAGAAVAVAAVGGSSGPPTVNAAAGTLAQAVAASVSTTEQAKTAHLALSMQLSVSGGNQATQSFSATGAGDIDFSNDAASMAIDYSGLPTLGDITMSVIYVGGTAYASLPQISAVFPGKSWVSVPVAGSGSFDPGSANPSDLLHILASGGNTVTALGPSTVDATAVQGYHVVVNADFIRARLGALGLPAAEQQAVAQILGSSGITFDVFIDGSDQLRRLVVDMSLGAGSGASGPTVTAHVQEDLSNFGEPVSVSPPPADQVLTPQQLESGAGSLGSVVG